MRRFLMCALATAVFMFAARGAPAGTVLFEFFPDGLQETPPVATPGTGFGTLSLDNVTGDYSLSGTFSDLIGTTTLAHIHGPAPPGTPAGVVVALTIDVGVTDGAFSGAGTLTLAQMTDLLNELYYVNIHTSFKPGGEIRGQIRVVPEPRSLLLFACGGAALGAVVLRRRA